jgi:ferric-dicitrate binding protein FerR (iron transport regulator)
LDRLVLEIGRALEVHFGNAEPQRLIDLIHGEVFLVAAAPVARIFIVEFGKQKLR